MTLVVNYTHLYEYVGSNPVAYIDPLGLYKLKFSGRGNRKFTDAQKKRIQDAHDQLKKCVKRLVEELNALERGLSDCVKCKLQEELDGLRDRLESIQRGLNSDREIVIRQRELATGVEAETLARRHRLIWAFSHTSGMVPLVDIQETRFDPLKITFNTRDDTNWNNATAVYLLSLLMHELVHVAEGERRDKDWDGTGSLRDAHVIDDMCGPNGDVTRSPTVRFMILKAARECGET